jgi:Ca2+-binding EF-hand superfamily protein
MVSNISGSINGAYTELSRPPDAEMKQHRQHMFTEMDTNADGAVDKAEFTAWGKQMAEAIGKPDRSEEMFAQMDADGDGVISQAEAESFTPPAPPMGGMKPEIGSNMLSVDSLSSLLEALESDDSTESQTLQDAIIRYLEANSSALRSSLNVLG